MALTQHNTLQDNAPSIIITAAVGSAGTSQSRTTDLMRIVGSGGSYPYALGLELSNPDYLYLNGTLFLQPNSPWSLSVRVKRAAGSVEHTFCGENQVLTGNGYSKIGFLANAGMTLTFVSDGNEITNVDLASYMSRDVWHTLGIANDGTESGTPYTYFVDGVQRATSIGHADMTIIDALGIGSGNFDTFPWDGGLSDFRVYDTQLNAAAMLAIHNEGAVDSLADSIDDRLTAASPSSSQLSIFSTPPSAHGGTYPFSAVYNTDLWGTGGADLFASGGVLTGIGWYTSQSFYGRAVAITARHIITTQHGRCYAGENVAWINADGTLVLRTVLAERGFVSGNPDYDDFWIGYLSSALPASVPIASLLDPDDYADVPYNMNGQPIIRTNGNNANKLLVGEAYISGDQLYFRKSEDTERRNYWTDVVDGDSGSPVFAMQGDTFIYLTNLTQRNYSSNAQGYYYSGQGPLAVSRMTDIQAAVDLLNTQYGTAYSLTLITPSEFVTTPAESLTSSPKGPRNLGVGIGF